MTQRGPGGHDDDHLPEQFLVDGVAPSVIGGGPPESPFEVAPDPEPPGRHRHAETTRPPGYGGAQPRRHPEQRQEPPTSPIPALRPPDPEFRQPQQEKKKSWLSRMFRG